MRSSRGNRASRIWVKSFAVTASDARRPVAFGGSIAGVGGPGSGLGAAGGGAGSRAVSALADAAAFGGRRTAATTFVSDSPAENAGRNSELAAAVGGGGSGAGADRAGATASSSGLAWLPGAESKIAVAASGSGGGLATEAAGPFRDGANRAPSISAVGAGAGAYAGGTARQSVSSHACPANTPPRAVTLSTTPKTPPRAESGRRVEGTAEPDREARVVGTGKPVKDQNSTSGQSI